MKVSSSQQYKPSFKAKLLSQWKCSNKKGTPKNITIVALEKRDLDFVQNFRTKLDKYEHLPNIHQAIIDASSNTICAVLENTGNIFEKVKMLMAVYDGKPCGFLIANIPKILPATQGTSYSSRHNPAKNETEIDWLVTWTPTRNEKIKGIGKSIVGEYFRTVNADKFRDVFVRSEIPEHTNAVYFYESLGFERLGKKRTKLGNKNTGQYMVNNFSECDDDVIPMIITKSKIRQKTQELSDAMCRKEFVKSSIDIYDIVER